VEKEKQSNIEYEKPNVQKMTSKEINREIYRTLHNRRNCISQWNQVETVRINKNSFSGKYQLSSKI